MQVTKKKPEEKADPGVPLKDTKPGDVIRFVHDSVEQAFEQNLFWLRIEAPEAQAKDRFRIVGFAKGNVLERDGDHRVVVHPDVVAQIG